MNDEKDEITPEEMEPGIEKLVEMAKKSNNEEVVLSLAVMLEELEFYPNLNDLLSHFAGKGVSSERLKKMIEENYRVAAGL